MKKFVVLALAVPCLITACKKADSANTQPSGSPTSQVAVTPESSPSTVTTADPKAAFEAAADRYIMDTKAVKTACEDLFATEKLNVIKKLGEPVVCAKMTFSSEDTRQFIDIAHGKNQAAPWEDGGFTSGVFAIEDNVLMSVLIFPDENALVFQIPRE